jgi:hypothetical protein
MVKAKTRGLLRIIATITIMVITTANNTNSIIHLQPLQRWQHGLAAAKSGESRAKYQHPACNKSNLKPVSKK